jgi:oligopeptide/dipeptide ABC transporter ATP-binding protein
MVFQDPYSSLNPRMSIGDAIGEPLDVHRVVSRAERAPEVKRLLGLVGLPASVVGRYPRELSGGQRQRVGIARALALRPELVIADEAVSGVDVSVRAQILNLLADLRDELKLTLLFISHDLSVVEYLSDRVAVMYLGQVMEVATGKDLFARPAHPYTEGLLAAVPSTDPAVHSRAPAVVGELPSAIHPPSGCVFRTRCFLAQEICKTATPTTAIAPGHTSACHFAMDVYARRHQNVAYELERGVPAEVTAGNGDRPSSN